MSRRKRGSGRRPAQSGAGESGAGESGAGESGAGESGARPSSRPGRSGGPAPGGAWTPGAPAPNRQPPRLPFVAQVGVLVVVFAVVSLIADLAGAANLGVALGIGVIAFAVALVALIVKN